jgi:hypothetical protein
MNERIEALAEQCGFRSNPDVYDRNQSFDIAKFAELIVRECCDWIDGVPTTDGGMILLTKSFMIANIKGHFGIER